MKVGTTIALLLLSTVASSPMPSGPAIGTTTEGATSFWYANMDHTGQYRGYAPDLDGDNTYAVYKVIQPGDGAAIQAAINDDNGKARHGQWLASQPRVS